MTAVYAFASPERRRGVLAADDHKLGDPGRVEKVIRCGSRYVTAVHGQDITADVLRGLAFNVSQFGEPATDWADVYKFAAAIRDYVELYAAPLVQKLRDAAGDDRIAKEVLSRQDACFVVLDCSEFRLFDVNLGRPLPYGNLNTNPDVVTLEPDVVHPFALAVPKPQVTGPVLGDAFAYPRKYCKEWIAESARMAPDDVGALGSWCDVRDDDVRMFSAFATFDEKLSQAMRGEFSVVLSATIHSEWKR